MLKKHIPFWGFVLVILGFFIWAENQFAPTFQSCVNQETAQKTPDGAKDNHQVISIAIESQTICSLRLIDAHSGFFAALATVFIAWFTYTLWIATTEQGRISAKTANAALLQARTAINIERPFVYVSDLKLARKPVPTQKDGTIPEIYEMVFVFTNYGRTPAFVTRIGHGHAVAATPPPEPIYGFVDDLAVEIVIRAGEAYRFTVPILLTIKPDQRKRIDDDEAFPWLWGQIRYRDFLDGVAETGFVAFQYPAVHVPGIQWPATFRFRRLPAYTYQRYEADSAGPSQPI